MQVFDGVLQGSFESEECTDACSSSDDITGYHTVRFLFSFGSSCFERYLQYSLFLYFVPAV